MPHALLVDDEPETTELLSTLVERQGFTTSVAGSLEEAREALAERSPQIILLDLKLPDGEGLELLDDLPELEAWPEVVLITGNASLDTAIEALRREVSDYLLKPVDVDRLKSVLARVSRAQQFRKEIHELRAELRELGRFGRLVGSSKPMQAVYDRISRVAPRDASVLISGESGTGKELAARTLHDLSRRSDGPLCAVNCGAVADTLIASELFGHEKGAFTGATRRHRGYFEQADGGTLFLDEITEMPPELQVRLLRVLESGEITRVGGERSIRVDVRVIAASNRALEEALHDQLLREDLYYRLNVFQIDMPPLRQRPDDIPLLAQFFLEEINEEEGTDKILDSEVLRVLQHHDWPGNVRELRNLVRSGHILADDVIGMDCLPLSPGDRKSAYGRGGPMKPAVRVPLGCTIAEAEHDLIMATLDLCDGNKTKAAETLGISVRTLYNRLKEYEDEGEAKAGIEEEAGSDDEAGHGEEGEAAEEEEEAVAR